MIPSASSWAKTVKYTLSVSQIKVNLSGKTEVNWALGVNNSIPAPTLEFTEGDDAEILVKNDLKNEEVSIHWHGILLPPEEDGVAYVNTPPIFPGKSRLFKFKIRQHGTYWYHSHTALQEQKGVYGAFVIYPKNPSIKVNKDVVAVLSDWSDENADHIMQNLKKDGDFYLYKKKSVRSILGALQAGSLGNYVTNEWDRMGGMDLSDVGYDAFLINGKRDSQLIDARAGERVRIRVINAAASSFFYLSLGNLPMKVISADGIDIEPIEANEILMGMTETYDILFTVPENNSYELRATVQDVTGFGSAWIGKGPKVSAKSKDSPDFYASMDHGYGHEGHNMEANSTSEHSHHSHHHGHHANAKTPKTIETLGVDDISSPKPTTLPEKAPVNEFTLVLGGDMERYVWHINGKAIHEDRDIFIKEGEVVRFKFVNETMMHHPMHLHGHFFRVLTQKGDKSPLKHTVDVPPHGTRTIEFYSDEPGHWMLHCHNLFHMKTGMARVIKYLSYKNSEEISHYSSHDPHLHDHTYFSGKADLATNHAGLNLKLMQTWSEWDLKLEGRNSNASAFNPQGTWDLDGDLLYRRWMGNFLNFNLGLSTFDGKFFGIIGLGYTLPLLIEGHLFINHQGFVRLNLEKRLQWTHDFFSEAEFTWRPGWTPDHETEYKISLMFGPAWNWAAGFVFTETSVGAGGFFKF